MTEREQLELAAKAAGYDVVQYSEYSGLQIGSEWWNPPKNDGDALRLAVKLNIHVLRYETMTTARPLFGSFGCDERDDGDPYAATRLAIFRAAAEIGRGM